MRTRRSAVGPRRGHHDVGLRVAVHRVLPRDSVCPAHHLRPGEVHCRGPVRRWRRCPQMDPGKCPRQTGWLPRFLRLSEVAADVETQHPVSAFKNESAAINGRVADFYIYISMGPMDDTRRASLLERSFSRPCVKTADGLKTPPLAGNCRMFGEPGGRAANQCRSVSERARPLPAAWAYNLWLFHRGSVVSASSPSQMFSL